MAGFYVFCLVAVALFSVQKASCRLLQENSASASTRALLFEPLAAAAQADRRDIGSKIDGQYIVMFKADAGDAATASSRLAASLPTKAVTAAAAAAGAAPAWQVLNTISLNLQPAASQGAAAAVTAAAARRRRGVQGMVVRATPEAAAAIQASNLVQIVIPDRVVVAEQFDSAPPAAAAPAEDLETQAAAAQVSSAATCVRSQALNSGARVAGVLAPSFKWPGCLVPGARIVWSGRACGRNGAKVQYTVMRAVDGKTGRVLRANGENCVARLNPSRATWSRQRFGTCGAKPLHVAQMPTTICGTSSRDPSGVRDTPASPSPPPQEEHVSPSPTPVDNGSNSGSDSVASPAPESPELPSPSPEVPQVVPSPVPVTPQRTGPVLARVPVVSGDEVPAGVMRVEAATVDGVPETSGLPLEQQVLVGVMDSGVDATHPDINYAGGRSFGFTEDNPEASADTDAYGHGTHVAGIIGAKNNGQGVVGVSPGTPVYSLKVLDGKGRGSLSSVMAAVSWVASEGVKMGIRVINLSLAANVDPSHPDYAATKEVVCAAFAQASEAGVLVTTAAGNYGATLKAYLPAACPHVAAVTAVNEAGTEPASFSNFLPMSDATPEDMARVIAAPGDKIKSTISYQKDASGYRILSGTSMACPHVAAIAANCIMAGACTSGMSGLDMLAALQAAAQERYSYAGATAYGFAGDATSTDNGKFYGLFAWSKW